MASFPPQPSASQWGDNLGNAAVSGLSRLLEKLCETLQRYGALISGPIMCYERTQTLHVRTHVFVHTILGLHVEGKKNKKKKTKERI